MSNEAQTPNDEVIRFELVKIAAQFKSPAQGVGDILTHAHWLLDFVKRNRLDGLYMDNAMFGKTWLDHYEFVRTLRDRLGDEAILYHHDSVDIWGLWSGRAFIPVDVYCDYTLKGETGVLAVIKDAESPYLRYYTAGYGFSQVLACHKRSKHSAITEADLFEVATRLHYSMRSSLSGLAAWRRDYWTRWRQRSSLYQAGKLNPDVAWPR